MEGQQQDELSKEKKPRKRMKAILMKIRQQMEFYFSDANLYKDRFLKQEIDKSPDGYIDLSVFLTFNRIKAITEDVEVLAKSLSKSKLLEVNKENMTIKRTKPLEEPKNVDERTVYVECLPHRIDHDWLKRVFSACGDVAYVSLPRYKTTGDPKGFAFVEFVTEAGAQKACQELNNPPVDAAERPGKFPVKGSKTLVQLRKKVKGTEDDGKDTQELQVSDGKENADIDLSSTMSKKKRKRRRQTSESSVDGSSEYSPVKQRRLESQESQEDDTGVKPEHDTGVKSEQADGGKSEDEDKSEKRKKKRKRNRRRTDSSHSVTDSENPDSSVKEEESDNKRQNIDTNPDVPGGEPSVEEGESLSKRPKLGLEEKKCETANENAEKINKIKKKSRKRKKKNKPEKYLPELRVLSKKEWLELRNEYLSLQKASMNRLKKSLVQLKQECSADTKASGKTVEPKQKGRVIEFVPGVIVKVEGRNAMTRKQIKDDLGESVEIAYIDIKDECMDGHIRCVDADSAQKITNLKTELYTFNLLTGDEEKRYWEKLKADRDTKLNTTQKSKKRGTQKLIEKAQKTNRAIVERKHIVFDD